MIYLFNHYFPDQTHQSKTLVTSQFCPSHPHSPNHSPSYHQHLNQHQNVQPKTHSNSQAQPQLLKSQSQMPSNASKPSDIDESVIVSIKHHYHKCTNISSTTPVSLNLTPHSFPHFSHSHSTLGQLSHHQILQLQGQQHLSAISTSISILTIATSIY
ncbi:hypothetical protein O181_058264 [Austropuccinia psidii MF-1]|uniref:Uncharacterized protein n=1 Tax=Austropuccinia psidii MF-1 TaxID=1389203 RepID=A0A9Q3EC01_9BASI|nr:hypothetical protein [Austropuccinia psidii MF-1]